MVRDSAMVTMDSLWETTVALSNGTIAQPLRLPFPQNGVLTLTSNVAFAKLLWLLLS